MKKVEYKSEEIWIPGDVPYEPGPYWVTWTLDQTTDTTDMFWDGSKWTWNDEELHKDAHILAYADIAYPIPYEE